MRVRVPVSVQTLGRHPTQPRPGSSMGNLISTTAWAQCQQKLLVAQLPVGEGPEAEVISRSTRPRPRPDLPLIDP